MPETLRAIANLPELQTPVRAAIFLESTVKLVPPKALRLLKEPEKERERFCIMAKNSSWFTWVVSALTGVEWRAVVTVLCP